MVDTPPINNKSTQSRLYGLLRTSDIFIFVSDLTNNPINQIENYFSELSEWGFKLINYIDKTPTTDLMTTKPIIILCNKADIPGALDEYQNVEQRYSAQFPVLMASADEEVGLDDLGIEIFKTLDIMRIYTKSPREKLSDFRKKDPIVLPTGSNVIDAATQVHKDLGNRLKYAVLWGESGKFKGQRVGRAHKLTDGDIIEIHN